MIAPSRHQLLVEQKSATDFERLEDIGADAIAAARHAHARAQALDGDTAYALRRELDDLRKIAENRTALTKDARESLRGLAKNLRDRVDADTSPPIGPLLEAVIDCLTASERVADLLAAERHIGRCRGIV
ncbi:hypothetical protein RAH32_09030 [Paracoccus sp. WLY502]|uniref:hypothetical protein n=1 Tax=Paracoccus yibinensis TaxID=3068891 RepID=UPI0027969AD6|nr:hypothetical protein [Paracoccus sp. WLY502]MDQ1900587.1 hypothetical protein [Paracoccus sp. WLY502]